MTPPTNQRRGAAPGRTGFAYKPRDPKLTQERAQRYRSGGRDGFLSSEVNTFAPAEGANWVRMLPPTWENPTHYAVDLYFHYDVGPDQNSYLCIEEMADFAKLAGVDDTVCFLCQEKREALQAGAVTEGVRALDSVARLGAWILNRKAEKDGPLFWQFSPTIDREIIAQAMDKHTNEMLNIDDPKTGYDVEFDRKGQGMTTKYTGIKIARRDSEVPQSAVDFVYDHPLPSVLKFYPQAYIAEQYKGPAAAGENTVIAGGPAKADEPPPDDDDKIPHDAPAETNRVQPRQTSAAAATPAATGNAARRARVAVAPKTPDFSGMDVNAMLDWADKHTLEVPSTVPDDEIAAFLTAKAIELKITE